MGLVNCYLGEVHRISCMDLKQPDFSHGGGEGHYLREIHNTLHGLQARELECFTWMGFCDKDYDMCIFS